jgi:hypothetical protein
MVAECRVRSRFTKKGTQMKQTSFLDFALPRPTQFFPTTPLRVTRIGAKRH